MLKGENLENHFGKVLSKHFESTYINLGSHGSSNDYSYLRIMKWLNNTLVPKNLGQPIGIFKMTIEYLWCLVFPVHKIT